MKFAKKLEEDAVPEWRLKYFDYKLGKKKVKRVGRAFDRLSKQTPQDNARVHGISGPRIGPRNWLFGNNSVTNLWSAQDEGDGIESSTLWQGVSGEEENGGQHEYRKKGTARSIQGLETIASNESSPEESNRENQPLRTPNANQVQSGAGQGVGYGSINSDFAQSTRNGPPSLALPDPALSVSHTSEGGRSQSHSDQNSTRRVSLTAPTGNAYEVGRTNTPSTGRGGLPPRSKSHFLPRRAISSPHTGPASSFRRLFHSRPEGQQQDDMPLEAYKEFDAAKVHFMAFLDQELHKVESFYAEKEQEAELRMQVIKDQLHIMRDRRVQEILQSQADIENPNGEPASRGASPVNAYSTGGNIKVTSAPKWVRELEDAVGFGQHRFGKNSAALSRMALEGSNERIDSGIGNDQNRDFARRPTSNEVSYRYAKRKLKDALQEFYRSLELLKSYSLVNRIAFRKINKKYDKTINSRPPLKYMSDKVNDAWFVRSEKVDTSLVEVEDLYARYFERGNRKVAVGKLRSRLSKRNYTSSVFRDGFLLGAGIIFAFEGLVDAVRHLEHIDPIIRQQTDFLLQLYGGYFLCLFLLMLFVLVCKVWKRSKINYVFIFEFDNRNNLDWRQLAEFPTLFMFFFGLSLWLNFQQVGTGPLFLWWPVFLVAATLAVMLLPAPVLFYRSRWWYLRSQTRLIFSGGFGVEFRDFFLGDMFCSLTYAMGNIYLFFCLYVRDWMDPPQCNSSHSRTVGFLTAVPGIWRALQCIRRYRDTKNVFPHLVNFGKYVATCLFYMTLSMYRLDRSRMHLSLVLAFGTLNSVYTSIWDLVMDWSLGDPRAHHPFLREHLVYKPIYWYYVAMVIDPLIRFNWVLYLAVPSSWQQSSLLSFLVAFSEVCRRGMWTIFRVENEHRTNVTRFRASRDIPLPYGTQDHEQPAEPPAPESVEAFPSGVQISSQLRRRRTEPSPGMGTPSSFGHSLSHVGTIISTAHAQDFERRRPVVAVDRGGDLGDSSDDDDENDTQT